MRRLSEAALAQRHDAFEGKVTSSHVGSDQVSIHSHLYRRTDPVTSRMAAELARGFLGTHELKIFHFLQSIARNPPPLCGGATYRDIAHAMGLEPVAVARRMKGMERKGVIRRMGVINGMTVWVAV